MKELSLRLVFAIFRGVAQFLVVRRLRVHCLKSSIMVFSSLAASMLLLTSCATHSTPPSEAASREFHIEAYLATLHAGMTARDAQRELNSSFCILILGPVGSHYISYLFPGGDTVTLQFDEHERLISWKEEKAQEEPPKTALETTGSAPLAETFALTKQITDILKECQTIKPGMTRAELSKVFTTEGGFSTARHRTYVYRGCPYIKVDVDFTLSDSKQGPLDERPTDIINKISKPYLEWSIND
jgi:hypothetical protein